MTDERQHHLESVFNRLKSMLSDLMESARSALINSIDALDRLDGDKARKIVTADSKIDELQRRIDRDICNYIARFQPLAGDLRYVVTMVKLATDLERIGDQAVNIAEVAIEYEGTRLAKPLVHIKQMTAIVEKMMDDIMTAYYNKDLELATDVWKQDERVDDIYSYIKKEVSEKLMEQPDEFMTKQFIDLVLVARFLERAADHITNIAEEIYFISRGKNLKEEIRN